MEKKNNVYGLIGIGVKNANWNANFDKYPKANIEGILKGSPYALQYCMKKQWDNVNEKVFGMKSFDECANCNTLNSRYELLFKEKDVKVKVDKKKKETIKQAIEQNNKVITNLLSCRDFLNFGTAYTGANTKSITGIVQFTDGMNKYELTAEPQPEIILSQFANPNAEDPTASTFGDRITVDEAHYVYDFSLFPKEYDKYKANGFKGYSEEDYKDFKNTSLIAVSNYNSKAKAGCKNEFAMFIEIKEEFNYLLDLNYLQDHVKVYKEGTDGKVIYDLTQIKELLNNKEVKIKIKSIEVYYNPRTVNVKGLEINIEDLKQIDLITREEIEKEK